MYPSVTHPSSSTYPIPLSVLVSLTGSWRVPIFVVVVGLLIVGYQEKPPVPGTGENILSHLYTDIH